MAYYLTAEEKKGKYRELPITKSMFFPKKHQFKKENACSLQEIDAVTVNFDDENELRLFLLKEDILPFNLADRKLSIRRLEKDKYIKVMYDFLYQKDIVYVNNPKELIAEINYRNKENDFMFLKKLAEAFQNYHECNQTASDLRDVANLSLETQIRSKYLDEKDRQGDNMVVRFLKLLIYENYQNRDGSVRYSKNIKYANLHKIIAFMDYYDQKPTLEEERPKVLTKTKPKEVNEEDYFQYSLFEDKK